MKKNQTQKENSNGLVKQRCDVLLPETVRCTEYHYTIFYGQSVQMIQHDVVRFGQNVRITRYWRVFVENYLQQMWWQYRRLTVFAKYCYFGNFLCIRRVPVKTFFTAAGGIIRNRFGLISVQRVENFVIRPINDQNNQADCPSLVNCCHISNCHRLWKFSIAPGIGHRRNNCQLLYAHCHQIRVDHDAVNLEYCPLIINVLQTLKKAIIYNADANSQKVSSQTLRKNFTSNCLNGAKEMKFHYCKSAKCTYWTMVASVSKKQLLLLRKTNEKQSYCTIYASVLSDYVANLAYEARNQICYLEMYSNLLIQMSKYCLMKIRLLYYVWEEDQSVLFKKLKRQYGDVYGIYLGPQLNVVVTDLDVARDILIKNFSCFTDRSNIAILEKKPMSECLFNLRQQEWKDIRSTVVHTFSNRIMREVLTVDVIAQCAFALDLDLNESQNRQFLDNCRQLFDGYDFNESWLILIFPEMIWFLKPFVSFTKFSKAEQRIVNDLREVLLRKKHLKCKQSIDLLQLLINSNELMENNERKGTPLTDDAIVANAMVFLLAGYETSSTAMGFAAWLLAKHPEVQEKLRQEVNVKFNDIQIGQEYDVIHDMPYMNAVMQETLRLYPPLVLLVVRTCIKECTINEIPFVPGVQVLFPTYSIHHDETIWPEPDRFLPERFIGSDCAHHPMAWLPFGAGPRNCIGKRFAEMQFKITMAHLLKRYRLHLSEAESEDPIKLKCNGATIRPRNGVVIKLSRY
ncbi:Cytochrome P450 3A12 [Trichinella spiralis]|uniref:Cytochrome P450 3A12 n=1 Tax=Trichinella spiralis TaxID=6334 RepID=A0A0V1AU86_TRISP|nr:Cytochrome P450 3A12 [Trichinella spiralis]